MRTSSQVLEEADSGSLRVMSVPVDALIEYADDYSVGSSTAFGYVMRSAITHITGETNV